MKRCLIYLLLVLALATHTVRSALLIADLVNRQHGIGGTVFVDNDRTIRIENFHYDGLGPDAFVYYYPKSISPTGSNGRPTSQGIIIPVPASAGGVASDGGRFAFGTSFSGQQLILTMPSGTTVHQIGYFTIWCRQANVFFNAPLRFPDTLVIPTGMTPTQPPTNCVSLNEQLQLTWTLNTTAAQPTATFTLCGCLRTNDYMAFGLSGNSDSINMVGGDVTVAWVDSEPHAEDYFLQRREQCRAGGGVCPDRTSTAGGTCREDNFDISGSVRNGVTCVTYSRRFDTGDTDCDSVFDMTRLSRTYIIWALGPRGDTAFQHFERSGFTQQPLNLTRDPVNECTAAPRCTNCKNFSTNSIIALEGRTFTAEIGASGGPQGYLGITGQAGWGIAWYINGMLIPELTLERNETYIFRVFGGNNESIRASYHPFYITDSPSGGRLLNTPAQRMDETVFAGFDENDQPTGVGTLCIYDEGSGSELIRQRCGTYQQYFNSLRRTCQANPPTAAEVVFRPNDTTPDIVYYQCATHKNLGWRIRIGAGAIVTQSWLTILALAAGAMALLIHF